MSLHVIKGCSIKRCPDCDELAAHDAEVANAAAKQALRMQWIPVSERLPHTHTVLGIVHDYPKGSEPFVDCVCYFPEHDSQRLLKCENLGWRFNGDEGAGELKVSHWCELPSPPAQEEPKK